MHLIGTRVVDLRVGKSVSVSKANIVKTIFALAVPTMVDEIIRFNNTTVDHTHVIQSQKLRRCDIL